MLCIFLPKVHYLILIYSVVGTACIEKQCFSIHDYCLFNNKNYVFIVKKGNKYNINDIYFIDRAYINESCIIPRTPLSSTAKRAGWQGCILVFNKFKSVKLPV